jgi:hypothetical protein
VFVERQARLKVLEALERSAKTFRTDEDLYPIRVPREPIPLLDLIDAALAGSTRVFDPLSLRQRTLLQLTWADGSAWEAWVVVLPSGLKLFCDAGAEEPRVLASGGRHGNDDTDRQFLQVLAETAGERFGIEMSGGAPSRLRTSLRDREFLIDVFVELFEVTQAEDSVLAQLPASVRDELHGRDGRDFRTAVEEWFTRAVK